MTIDEKEFRRRTQRAEDARQARDKATGQLDGLMERLRDEFDCGTIEEAEELATKLASQAAKAEQAYDKAATMFEEVWDDRLTE